jgi:protein TonB
VSIAGHGLLIACVIVVPLLFAADSLPQAPTIMAFVAAAPPPPPPPPPPAAARAAGAARSKPQPVKTPGAFAAPVEAPFDVTPEPVAFAGGGEGVEGGVDGGIAGGVAGGIVGGLVTAVPPPPPPPPPVVESGPVRIGGNIQAPALTKRIEPVYPDMAVLAKVTGLVILEATVGVDGAVDQVRVLRSVKLLDQAAVDAVKQWRYSPLMLNGVPTPFVLSVTLSFSLKQG